MNKLIPILSIMAITIMMVSLTEQAEANIWHDLGDGVDNYRQREQDGKDAGARGESSNCPGSGVMYCLGWNSGYYDGQKARDTVDGAYDDDDDDDDD